MLFNSRDSSIPFQNQTNHSILHGRTEEVACIQFMLFHFEDAMTKVIDAHISNVAIVIEDCLACALISFNARRLWLIEDDSG